MLVCNVSLRPSRKGIAADLAEAAAAADSPGAGNVVFATLVDDPASVGDFVDAYLGEIMAETASASDTVSVGIIYDADIIAAVTSTDTLDATISPAVTTSFDGTNTLVALSNGNLTVTHNNTTTNAGAISTAAKSTGKYYFEITIQTSTGGVYNGIGAISSAWTGVFSSSQGSSNLTGVNPGTSNSLIYSNGSSTGISLGPVAVGNVFCFALDLTARLAWVRKNNGSWNNSGTADPATGIGGVTIAPTVTFRPYVSFATSSVSTDAITANFGASAFAYSVPSGFTAGWY
jgi:hypothetical protein